MIKRTWSLAVLPILMVLAVILWRPWAETHLIGDPEFSPIGLVERTTSVIIIHGIGDHCIGYADTLISSLFTELTKQETESMAVFHERKQEQARGQDIAKVKHEAKHIAEAVEQASTTPGGPPTVGRKARFRDGSCLVVEDDDSSDQTGGADDTLESITADQEELCKSINDEDTASDDIDVGCHKLYVNKDPKLMKKKNVNPEYVTGFVRRLSFDLTAGRRLRVYEVTWSPATRWIKQSLIDLEKFNNPESEHPLNRLLKSTVVNAAMADAVAYLSDSGILVNFDILQAFCMTFANNRDLVERFDFACDQEHLNEVTDSFSKDNAVFLITHSLGTRVLFDSLGMLALGAPGANSRSENRPSLMEAFVSKFEIIGAEIPPSYGMKFTQDLGERIPEFAKSIRSIYTFTNQVPLLAATLSSPFRKTPPPEVGMGFQDFLELREDNSRQDRLQVVAFHDPDDILSYDLGCWYYQSVLKGLRDTKNLIEKQAEVGAGARGVTRDSKDWNAVMGDERTKVRNALFKNTCSNHKLNLVNQKLYEEIWDVGQNRLNLVEAGVRLNGFRVAGLFANPLGVHSNYFVDKTVHRWLVDGPPKGKRK